MQVLSDILPAAMSSADLRRELQRGSMTPAGNINQLQAIRIHPLTENQLTAIASQMLQTPFSITSEEKKIYGRKKITDEYGEYWLDNQFLETEQGIDCIVHINQNVPKNILQSALMLSPKESYVKHLTHLTMHKKFGSTDQDRTIMLNDYIQGLSVFPEFVVYQVCKHYWENDRRPFVPFIAEMKEACQIFTDAVQYFFSKNVNETSKKIDSVIPKPEEPWIPPTADEKVKISEMIESFAKSVGVS